MTEDRIKDPLEYHVRSILEIVGEDPSREGLLDTPKRVAKMYREIFGGLHEDPAVHLQRQFTTTSDSMVVVRDIPFNTVCEHHLVPFVGVAHVGYVPGEIEVPLGERRQYRIAGLSKFARVIDGFARRPQVQENLTAQVGECIWLELAPQSVIVVMKAEHMCMSLRGVKKHGSSTVTSSVWGKLFDKNVDGLKDEFMSAITL